MSHSGLRNIGATDHINAVLQQFYAIAPLRVRLLEYQGADAITTKLRELFEAMSQGSESRASPGPLVRELQLNPRVSGDAHDFFMIRFDIRIQGWINPLSILW
jgi:hypothetical protein